MTIARPVHLLLAGVAAISSPGAVPAFAQSAFSTLDRTAQGRIEFSSGERGKPILAGSTVTVSGEGFRPAQQISLLYGDRPLPGGDLTADAAGKVTGRITVPAGAVAGIHPIVVLSRAPYTASVAELKVSPTVPLSGQANYTVTEANVARGLYQSALSPRTGMLFVTSAIGRPPVRQSELVKIDAATMKVVARVTPQEAPPPAARGGSGAPDARAGGAPAGRPGGAPGEADAPSGPPLFAVYGVGVDDAKGTVWVTQSRQNTVAVYRQSDLSLVKQFPAETVNHPRDVVVDGGKAYVSATFTPRVAVIDTTTLEPGKPIEIDSTRRRQDFSAASLSLDAAAHRLYVVSNSTNEVAIIDTRTDTVAKVLPVPAKGVIGVSHDPQTGRIFVASQGDDTLTVLDGNTGAVVASTPVGAGALNVVFDPVKRRAYVANRGAGTVTVTDADGRIVANLGPSPMVNHVSLGLRGTVFAVDKSAGPQGEDSDTILKIVPKR